MIHILTLWMALSCKPDRPAEPDGYWDTCNEEFDSDGVECMAGLICDRTRGVCTVICSEDSGCPLFDGRTTICFEGMCVLVTQNQ
jgi:hypothetical protein